MRNIPKKIDVEIEESQLKNRAKVQREEEAKVQAELTEGFSNQPSF